MRPNVSGRRADPRILQYERLLANFQVSLAAFGQVIARLVEGAGGSYRVVECGSCSQDPKSAIQLLEITLPDGPSFLVALHDRNVLTETPVKLDSPPQIDMNPEGLFAWVQGISLPE